MKSKKLHNSHIFIAALLLLIVSMTACGTNSSDPSTTAWKFAYMSDNKDAVNESGINDVVVGLIAQDMAAQGASLVLVGGDLIDGRGLDVTGLNAQYENWMTAMAPVYNASIPVCAVPGNHEYWCETEDDCINSWLEMVVPTLPAGRVDNDSYPGREYSFIFNNAFFIGLDQNQYGPSMPDYYRGNDVEWISNQLAGRDVTAQPHVIAFGHMPQFMMQYGWSAANKENRDLFWSELGDVGGKMYFTGHSHTYALGLATTVDGTQSIYQTLAGSAGAGFESGSWNGVYYESDRVSSIDRNNVYNGYALVTIDGRDVSMEWRYYDSDEGAFKSRSGFRYTQ